MRNIKILIIYVTIKWGTFIQRIKELFRRIIKRIKGV